MESKLAASLGAALLALACAVPPEPPAAPPEPVVPPAVVQPPPAASALPLPCDRIERVFVHKGRRTLWVSCAGGAVVALRIAIGRGGAEPKQARGDQRTPEGEYRIAGSARASRFHRFLPIDYPSLADADRALAAGRLAARDHARIAAAHRAGAAPPSDTPLGGGLGLHGEGVRWRGESAALDWTDGCVALPDADFDFLARRLAVGTPIVLLGRDAPLPVLPPPHD